MSRRASLPKAYADRPVRNVNQISTVKLVEFYIDGYPEATIRILSRRSMKLDPNAVIESFRVSSALFK